MGLSAATLTSALQNYPGSAGQGIAAAGTAFGWIIFLADRRFLFSLQGPVGRS